MKFLGFLLADAKDADQQFTLNVANQVMHDIAETYRDQLCQAF